MKLDDRTLALVAAIRAEANATITPSQYDRLQAIADRLKELEPAIRKDEEAKVALFMAVEAVRDLRIRIEAMVDARPVKDTAYTQALRDVLDLFGKEEDT